MSGIQRDIGSLTESDIQAEAYRHYDFVSIDGDVDFGVVRYTNRASDWTGDLDGSSQTWKGGELSGLRVERISQSNTSVLDVSTISFLNLFDTGVAGHAIWTQREMQFGLAGRTVTVYDAWWDPDDDSDSGFVDKFVLFKGRIGATEHAVRSTLTLVPFRTPYNIPTGRVMSDKVCAFALAREFKGPLCQYAGGDTSCTGTIPDCTAKGNIEHFGGFPKMLKPNTTLNWGVVKVAL